eukprot:SM000141S00922  [mRNA]  locus=s141:240772:249829:- [translate_table: standard]
MAAGARTERLYLEPCRRRHRLLWRTAAAASSVFPVVPLDGAGSDAALLDGRGDAAEVVLRFYGAINRRDVDAAVALIAEDCISEDMIYPRPFVGMQAVRAHFESVLAALPLGINFAVDNISRNDKTAVGMTWHADIDGKVLPFSNGCSFYRCEPRDKELRIVYGRDIPEHSIKPGAATVLPSRRRRRRRRRHRRHQPRRPRGRGAGSMATGWLRGTVKAVPSGDSLVIMGAVKSGPPPEKIITLSSLMAPKLARKDTLDEPYAWASRESLRKKCIGKDVIFKVDYAVPSIKREFGSVFMGDTNLALVVVAEGWAKVKSQVGAGEASPYLVELQNAEEQARTQGLGMWSKTPGAGDASIRKIPPSGVGQDNSFDVQGLLESSKGKPLPAIVEQVRDGSTVRVLLLPSFQYVQVYIAGIQSPSMGRRPSGAEAATEYGSAEPPVVNGTAETTPGGPMTSAQRLAAANTMQEKTEENPEPFAREAKHFTEVRCLHRDIRVVLEGVDGKFNNLIGSVYFPDGDTATNLGPLLIAQGLAKVVEWSANMLEPEAKQALKKAELAAKQEKLRIWTNFVPPPSHSTAIRDDNYTGQVIEVVSGDCLVVLDSGVPPTSPLAERRVNLSSIRAKRMGNPRRDEKPEPYAREAKEFLRTRLIGQQVSVAMEYIRKIVPSDLLPGTPAPAGSRSMEFGTVMLLSAVKADLAETGVSATSSEATPQGSINVAEMTVARGFATVVRHRDFEERSLHYDALLAAEQRAMKGKKGIHSAREPPVAHINDLSDRAATAKARQFLPFLQRARRLPAIVDYVLSGHRFKLIIPKETCAIAFSLSGVRAPSREEPYSEEAIAFMRRRIMQHDVEIEVETVDKTGTFIGTLWSGKNQNAGAMLLDAGLSKLHATFSADRTPEGQQLLQAEQKAKAARLKVWENYVEGADAPALASEAPRGKQEVLQVKVTEILGGGKFYLQLLLGDLAKLRSIESQLEELRIKERPIAPGAFQPKKGDIVISQFSADNSWARAMVTNAPKAAPTSGSAEYEVFYIDFGNAETVTLSRLRPAEGFALQEPSLALLASLAFLKVPELEDDFGVEAAEALAHFAMNKKMVAKVEERDLTGGKVKGQGTGPRLIVTLVDPETSTTANASLLEAGLAKLEKRSKLDSKERAEALDSLKESQDTAKKARLAIWRYGDADSDEEEEHRRPSRFEAPFVVAATP